MRRSVSIILGVALVATAISGGLLLLSFSRSTREVLAESRHSAGAEFHLTVILPDDTDEFYRSLVRGGQDEALLHGAALELLYFGSIRGEPGLLLRQARWMHTDGVLVYLPEHNSFTREIADLMRAGIPVITLVNDNPLSGRTAHLGFDAEGIARELVRLMVDSATDEPHTWGVLISADGSGNPGWQGQRMEAVIRAMLAPKSNIRLLPTRVVEAGYFPGEQEAAHLLRDHSQLTGIVVAVPQTLGGVVQVLIDQNRLGDIAVVGIDFGSGVEDALARGLLNGTVLRHPEQVGATGVRTLMEAVKGGRVPEYSDLDYSAVDQRSVVGLR